MATRFISPAYVAQATIWSTSQIHAAAPIAARSAPARCSSWRPRSILIKSYAVLDQAFVTGGAHRYYYLPGCEAMDEDCGSRRVLV